MKTFENFRKVINESDYILSEARRYLEILLEKDSEAFKQYKKSQKSFEKGFGKNIKPTVTQPGLDLYKAGGPFVPDKTTFKDTGKKVPKMEPKPQFGKPKTVTKPKSGAPDKTLLKQAIKDVKASEKRLFDKGLGKGTAGIKGAKGKSGISLARQRKYTIDKIKDLSAKTTQSDARMRGSSTEGTAGAGGSSKTTKPRTVTPTKPQKSASAIDYTKKINQANKNRKEFTGNKKSFQAFKKQADAASDKLVSKREVVRSAKSTKDVKKLRDINKQIQSTERISKAYDAASKNIGNVKNPIVKASDLKQVTANTAKVTFNPTKPQKGKELVPNAMSGSKSKGKGNIVSKTNKSNVPKKVVKKFGLGTKKYASVSSANKAFGQSPTGKIIKKVFGTKPSYATRKITKTLGKKALKAAPVLAIPAGILASPYLRTGVKGALLGGGLAAFKNPKQGELAKLSSKKIVGSPVKLGQKIPTTFSKPK